MDGLKEVYKKIPKEYVILGLIMFILMWLMIAFRILMFGCLSPVITVNTTAIDSLDCDVLEKLIIYDQKVPSNRTLYCKNYDKTTIAVDYYGQEYLKKIYIEKCAKSLNP